MKIDASLLSFMPDLANILRSYKPEGERLIVAARVTGHVKTAFPDGKPKEPAKEEDANSAPEIDSDDKLSQQHLTESKDSINVIVVADTDILQDKFWAQVQNFFGQRIGIPTSGNRTFVTNALDNLTGSNDLISVRSRAGYSRPFTLLRALQALWVYHRERLSSRVPSLELRRSIFRLRVCSCAGCSQDLA